MITSLPHFEYWFGASLIREFNGFKYLNFNVDFTV